MKILLINACVRENSRTLMLARHLLKGLKGDITEVELQKEKMTALDRETLAQREILLSNGQTDHPVFDYARQFAEADVIVVAAPYWDLSFPALLKVYMEAVTVCGITFRYLMDGPVGLCKARQLIYVTTAGGPVFADFGYQYVKTLSEAFYGIKKTLCFCAENLDVIGTDDEKILAQAKEDIDRYLAEEWRNNE